MTRTRCALGLIAPALSLALSPGEVRAEDEPANQLHYPLADDLAQQLVAADAARAAGQHEQASDGYRAVLDQDVNGKGYQIARREQGVGAGEARRFVGVTQWAIEGLRALPVEGQRIFRSRYDYRASSKREEAARAADPFRALAKVYEQFPISSHAPGILETMAELALERGELDRARIVLERLLAHHEAELPSPPRVRLKLLACAVGLGRPDKVRELVAQLRRDDPEGKVHLTLTPTTLEELERAALRYESARLGRTPGTGRVPQPRIDGANRAVVDSKLVIGPRRFEPRVFGGDERAGSPRQAFVMPGAPQSMPARNLPLVNEGAAFIVTADQLLAWDVDTGEERPRIPRLGPPFDDQNPKVQFGGAIEQDMLVCGHVDEVLQAQQYRGIPIKVKIPIRKLAGFELGSWRWAWNHSRLLDDGPLEKWSFPAPPVASEGVVFAPAFSIEGFVNCHVAAFSARTGEPLWSSWVVSGQVEQTMFGEQATEPQCVPVAVSDGIVYHCTSFGCVTALDADTGRVLWVTEYPQLEVRAPRGYYAEMRTIQWESNAPIVESGVVIVAPLDSDVYVGLDARTGERLWEGRRRAYAADSDMRYLLAAGNGAVLLGGGNEVRCLSARTGKLMWNVRMRGRAVSGRGCIADGTAVVPVDHNEVFLYEVATGKKTGNIEVGATGNVAVTPEHVIIVGGGTLVIHRNSAASGQGGRDF